MVGGGIGKGLSRPLSSWGNGHVAVDIVIMYIALLVGGQSNIVFGSELRATVSGAFAGNNLHVLESSVFDNR